MGGTEMRALAVHDGKLFAGNGFWEDKPGAETRPGPQILVLDGPNARWRVDKDFDDLLPRGRRRHLAISALSEITFRTDGNGKPLQRPRSLVLATTWDLTGTRTIFIRDDATGTWSGTKLAQDPPKPEILPQIRAFGAHTDRATGADTVFAGDTAGIFSGVASAGGVAWNTTPELPITEAASQGFPGLEGHVRISSFAEADGHLFAAIGQQIWVRQDGATPSWRLFYTNTQPYFSETGLRGLTAISEQGHEVLLTAVEGRRSRIIRIDARTAADATDLDLAGFLDAAWHTKVSYVIGAYNDMPEIAVPGGKALLIGLEAFIPAAAPRPPGHTVLDIRQGLEAGGWFLLRRPGGQYELHEVRQPQPQNGVGLVAVRVAQPSPFPGQSATTYLGGYDANKVPAHDTAWIAQGSIGAGPK
jgi:hypothetical protein